MEPTLSIAEQRHVLNSFLEEADDDKLQRLFRLFVSNFLEEADDSDLAEVQLAEVFRRREAYLRGEMKAHPWREVMERLKSRAGHSK